MADSRGQAQKRSGRLQAAVQELQHHNTRVRIFARLVGMSQDPSAEYNPSCFQFALTFWQALIEADSLGRCDLKTFATWLQGTWARSRCVFVCFCLCVCLCVSTLIVCVACNAYALWKTLYIQTHTLIHTHTHTHTHTRI